jgi:hypothetical protein
MKKFWSLKALSFKSSSIILGYIFTLNKLVYNI